MRTHDLRHALEYLAFLIFPSWGGATWTENPLHLIVATLDALEARQCLRVGWLRVDINSTQKISWCLRTSIAAQYSEVLLAVLRRAAWASCSDKVLGRTAWARCLGKVRVWLLTAWRWPAVWLTAGWLLAGWLAG